MWPQGINIPFRPILIDSQQTVQVGASSVPPVPFLQCLFSIFTTGNFETASVLALFFLAYSAASLSLILLAISMKSPSEKKLLLKLLMNISGENP